MRSLKLSALHLFLAWMIFWIAIPTRADIYPITEVTISDATSSDETVVLLPHFLRQNQSGLVTFYWKLSLPAELHRARLPALLLPQPVQGATFWIGDELIHEITSSDENSLRNWYQPVLVSIPKHLLSSKDTVIKVRQSGYLRGWFVSPMFAGELNDLRPWFDAYTLLSQTLSVTINFLSGLIGFFLLGIGWRSNGRAFIYSGSGILIWSFLFTLALIDEVGTNQWYYWRLALYLLTGLLIYFISLFMFEIFRQDLRKRWQIAFFVYLNLGWLIFFFWGHQAEFFLDFYWTGSAIGIYVVTTVWIIGKTVQQRNFRALIPFFIHALISSFFAFHDYILQAGWLPLTLSSQVQPLWKYALLQHIYLTHLALPSFVIMAMWMLANDHLRKTNEALNHERQLQQQREQMVSDIHDGVGSRINMLLLDLRSSSSSLDQIELELQRCMDELRFAINPREVSHETLNKALGDLVQRLQHVAQHVKVNYSRLGTPNAIRADLGIQLYKVTQECLSNALRHSHAKGIDIELIQLPEMIQVIVSDDGRGIPHWDNDTQTQTSRMPTSLGLLGVQQRMLSKGGGVLIESDAQGTRVKCWLPLN